jgi:hypothetical protein
MIVRLPWGVLWKALKIPFFCTNFYQILNTKVFSAQYTTTQMTIILYNNEYTSIINIYFYEFFLPI